MTKEKFFEKLKLQAERNGFREVIILGTHDNGQYVAFEYTGRGFSDRRFASIKLCKDGVTFRKHTYRGCEWTIGISENSFPDVVGRLDS